MCFAIIGRSRLREPMGPWAAFWADLQAWVLPGPLSRLGTRAWRWSSPNKVCLHMCTDIHWAGFGPFQIPFSRFGLTVHVYVTVVFIRSLSGSTVASCFNVLVFRISHTQKLIFLQIDLAGLGTI